MQQNIFMKQLQMILVILKQHLCTGTEEIIL